MREEGRYSVPVSLNIGLVVLVLLLLPIFGMIANMKRIVISLRQAMQ